MLSAVGFAVYKLIDSGGHSNKNKRTGHRNKPPNKLDVLLALQSKHCNHYKLSPPGAYMQRMQESAEWTPSSNVFVLTRIPMQMATFWAPKLELWHFHHHYHQHYHTAVPTTKNNNNHMNSHHDTITSSIQLLCKRKHWCGTSAKLINKDISSSVDTTITTTARNSSMAATAIAMTETAKRQKTTTVSTTARTAMQHAPNTNKSRTQPTNKYNNDRRTSFSSVGG